MITRSSWTLVDNDQTKDLALAQCKGIYQRHLIQGLESVSGSTLRGKARIWGGRYAASRQNLMRRLKRAGIQIAIKTAEHSARLLVLSAA